VHQRVSRKLGWDREAPTWRDIAKAAETRKFTYGMTDPSASNSGFSALVGVASALSGGGAALDAKRAIEVPDDLRRFFAAQTMTAGSSGWLISLSSSPASWTARMASSTTSRCCSASMPRESSRSL